MIVILMWFICPAVKGEGHVLMATYTISAEPDRIQFKKETVLDGAVISQCNSPTLTEQDVYDWVTRAFNSDKQQTEQRSCEVEFYDLLDSHDKISQLILGTSVVLQRRRGCLINGSEVLMFDKWKVNGEDFLTFDTKTRAWKAESPQATSVAQEWNNPNSRNTVRNHEFELFQLKTCQLVHKLLTAKKIADMKIDDHTLEFLYTVHSEPGGKLLFQKTTVLDGVIISHCDSSTLREQPKYDWVYVNFSAEELERTHQYCLRERFDQEGKMRKISHLTDFIPAVLQRYRNCMAKGSDVSILDKWGLNGEDLLTFDSESLSWTSDSPLADSVQYLWNMKDNQAYNVMTKDFLKNDCLSLIHKFTKGREKQNAHKRNTRKKFYMFAKPIPKTKTLSLTCHVTYNESSAPQIQLTWNGKPLTDGLTLRGPLPNGDETSQLRLSAEIEATDKHRYWCEVQFQSGSFHIQWDGRTQQGEPPILPHNADSFSHLHYVPAIILLMILIIGTLIHILAKLYECRNSTLNIFRRRTDVIPQVTVFLYHASQVRGQGMDADDEYYGPTHVTSTV